LEDVFRTLSIFPIHFISYLLTRYVRDMVRVRDETYV